MIGPGLLGQSGPLDAVIAGAGVLVVTNDTVAALYLDPVLRALAGRRVAHCVLPDGEQWKTLRTLERVFDALVEARLNRDATLLALGGGVVGDITGFAAACYQRGVAYVQIPTTLLAQVDSAVGGKTGVNHPGGKNLIGAFHQPRAVVCDTDTLATLPERELKAGLAEVIKYGCIRDLALFEWLELNMARLIGRDPEALEHAVARCCAIKAEVVAKDEREQNLRAILNFGHTFGHAIEAATNYRGYLHGEAVALGMVMASDLSHRLELIDAADSGRVAALLAAAGLPTEPPRIGAGRVLELMRMDKKVLDGRVRLVLLDELGSAVVSGEYAQSALDATLQAFVA
jgi:3-dehydroquinate synthase